jgi:hypothetical protein
MMKKQIRKVAIREFSRNIYPQLRDLPVAIYNKKTKKCIVVIISPKEGGEKYDL